MAGGGDADAGVVIDEAIGGDTGEEAGAFVAVGWFCGEPGGGADEGLPGHFEEVEGGLVAVGEGGVFERVVGGDEDGGMEEGFGVGGGIAGAVDEAAAGEALVGVEEEGGVPGKVVVFGGGVHGGMDDGIPK